MPSRDEKRRLDYLEKKAEEKKHKKYMKDLNKKNKGRTQDEIQ